MHHAMPWVRRNWQGADDLVRIRENQKRKRGRKTEILCRDAQERILLMNDKELKKQLEEESLRYIQRIETKDPLEVLDDLPAGFVFCQYKNRSSIINADFISSIDFIEEPPSLTVNLSNGESYYGVTNVEDFFDNLVGQRGNATSRLNQMEVEAHKAFEEVKNA